MRKEYILRIEEETYEEIKNIADKNERSVNAQINYILKRYIEDNKTKKEE